MQMYPLTLIVVFLVFVNNCISSKRGADERYKRSAYAYSTEVKIQCFSGDSLVKLSNGEEKQIRYLKTGDELLTIDKYSIVSTSMIMMLHKQISKKALFYQLTTKSSHQISLTENHLIPIKSFDGNEKYLPAKDIQIGDFLVILLNNTLEYSPVINKRILIKKGYYAPLTMKGTLFINNILSSCFANVKDHHLAQFSMFPFRLYYQLSRLVHLNDPFNDKNTEDIHPFIKLIFSFALYFLPQTLLF